MTSGIFDGTFVRGLAAAQVRGDAWLRAMLDVEVALAWAAAKVGLVSNEAAGAVSAGRYRIVGSPPEDGDVPEGLEGWNLEDAAVHQSIDLGLASAASGNPVVPLVPLLERASGRVGAAAVHVGATSQDILDTAAVLVARRAGVPLMAELDAAAAALAELAERHRDTVMTGRTLLQQALPTTFGLRAATWAAGLDRAGSDLLAAIVSLPLQYGGAVGTLAGGPPGSGLAVRAALALELGLPEPTLAWHTDRTPIGRLAGALGVVAGSIATVALDLVLLAQSEVGEVSEDIPGGGGSSAMPHKRNPIAAVSARACAARCPGLVTTLLSAMAQEHERGAGAWHSEWETLSDLLRLTGSAAAWLRDAVDHLRVDEAAMRAHADEAADAASSASLAAVLAPALGRSRAHELVAAAAVRSRREGGRLVDAVRALAPPGTLDGLDLPAASIDTGSAGVLVDTWVAARRTAGGPFGVPTQATS